MLDRSQKVYDATIKKDEIELANLIDQIHEEESTIFDYNDEHALTSIINLVYLRARNYYVISKELQSGKGREDLVFFT